MALSYTGQAPAKRRRRDRPQKTMAYPKRGEGREKGAGGTGHKRRWPNLNGEKGRKKAPAGQATKDDGLSYTGQAPAKRRRQDRPQKTMAYPTRGKRRQKGAGGTGHKRRWPILHGASAGKKAPAGQATKDD